MTPTPPEPGPNAGPDPARHGPSAAAVILPLVALAALLAGGAAAAWLYAAPLLTPEAIDALLREMRAWGPLLIVLLMIVHCFVPYPAEILALCAGAVYGAAEGAALVWLGAMIGAALSFALARWLGRGAVARLLSSAQRDRLDAWTDRTGTMALLVARFMPVIAFNLINYAAGLTRVGWWTFLWTTAVGILPLTLLMTWLGAEMRAFSLQSALAVSAGGLAAVLLVHLALRRRAARRG